MKITALTLLLFIGTTVFAQTTPAKVLTAFKTKYPKVDYVEWDQENGIHSASFVHNDNDMVVDYDKLGVLVQTKEYVSEEKIPANINAAVEKAYPDPIYESVYKVTTKENTVSYLISLVSDSNTYLVEMSSDGAVTKSEKIELDDFEND